MYIKVLYLPNNKRERKKKTLRKQYTIHNIHSHKSQKNTDMSSGVILKKGREGADPMSRGMLFHSLGPATEKA